MRWLPDALTYLRVSLTAVTYPVALAGHEALFTVLVLAIVMTDVLDGPLARRLGTTDVRGANMDSAADFLFYASLPIWTYAFRPDVVTSLLPWVVVFFVAYAAANVVSRLRRGVLGFHNRFTRAAGTVGVVFALYTVLWGFERLLFLAILALLAADLAQRAVHLARPSGRSGAFTPRQGKA